MRIVVKNDGNSCRAGFGGRIVRMGSGPILDRFQAQGIWEMSGKVRRASWEEGLERFLLTRWPLSSSIPPTLPVPPASTFLRKPFDREPAVVFVPPGCMDVTMSLPTILGQLPSPVVSYEAVLSVLSIGLTAYFWLVKARREVRFRRVLELGSPLKPSTETPSLLMVLDYPDGRNVRVHLHDTTTRTNYRFLISHIEIGKTTLCLVPLAQTTEAPPTLIESPKPDAEPEPKLPPAAVPEVESLPAPPDSLSGS